MDPILSGKKELSLHTFWKKGAVPLYFLKEGAVATILFKKRELWPPYFLERESCGPHTFWKEGAVAPILSGKRELCYHTF